MRLGAFNTIVENHSKFFLPEIYIISLGLFLLVGSVIVSNLKKYFYARFVGEMTVLSVLVILFTLLLVINNSLGGAVIFNSLFVVDGFSNSIKVFGLVTILSCLGVSSGFVVRTGVNSFEYLILILFSTFGLLCLISSFDLVSMYISLEVQSLAFYILANVRRSSAFSAEAGVKYFVLGAFSSAILLLGISFIYGSLGTTGFSSLSIFFIGFDFSSTAFGGGFSIANRIVAGIVLIFAGILFKLAAAPFHMWSPDVYEGSPLFITTLFSVVPKIGMLFIAIKLFYFVLYDCLAYWQFVGLFCCFFSLVVGSLKALQQSKIKRFLAYSSVGHVGFLLLSVSTGTLLGIQSLLVYLVIYTITMINVWAIVFSLQVKGRNFGQLRYINDLQGLSRVNPLLSYTLAINMFSMAGIPPLAGFFAKFYVLFAGLEADFSILVVIFALFSVVSAFYYIRFTKIVFFDESNVGFLYSTNFLHYFHSLLLSLSFLFILLFVLCPSPLFLWVPCITNI